MTTITKNIEWPLAVEDYVTDKQDSDFAELAFDAVKDLGAEDVNDTLVKILANNEIEGVTIEGQIEFVEFDSGNWTHANGYFAVTLLIDPDVADYERLNELFMFDEE